MWQIELSLLASLDRTSNKGLSISFFCFPAWHTELFPIQTFPKTLSPNLITFTATNHTSPQQKHHEVMFRSSSRVGEYPKAISKIACLPQNPQHSVSLYSSSISVRSCPNMTARFLTICELNGKCNLCHSPDIQQWRKKQDDGRGENHSLWQIEERKKSLGQESYSGSWSKRISDPKATGNP